MPWYAVIRKEAFKSTKQVNIGDGQTELFLNFSHNGLCTGFTEFDSATDRTEKWLFSDGVATFVDEYLAIVVEDAKCEGADAWRGHEVKSIYPAECVTVTMLINVCDRVSRHSG